MSGIMIPPNAASARIPKALVLKQVLFMDGIHRGIEMAALSYQRLHVGAVEASRVQRSGENPESISILMTSLLLDAWSFVDCIERLRGLLHRWPGRTKKTTREIDVFIGATEDYRALRNKIQHLEGEIPALVLNKEPIWGAVGWVDYDPESKEVSRFVAIAGPLLHETVYATGKPDEDTVEVPVDHISLTSCGMHISLTKTVKQLKKLAEDYDAIIARSMSKQLPPDAEVYPADILAAVQFR